MTPPDVVIPVRPGERNEELRYALRSLSAIPHGEVWLCGHKPSWVSDEARFVHVRQNGTKYQNSLRNLLTACRQPQLSGSFYLWNDDMFLLRPVDSVPVYHRGTLAEHLRAYHALRHSLYIRGLATTKQILQKLGVEDPLSYEMHVPLPMERGHVLAAHGRATTRDMPKTGAPQIKSLYGNLMQLGGEEARDVKVFKVPDPGWAPDPTGFVSTTDRLWNQHPATLLVQELYPDPSPYEKP